MRGLLIFDLDGTLMDTRHDIAAAVNRMRRDYGLGPLSVERVTRYVGDGLSELVRRALADAPTVNVAEATRLCARYYDERLHAETALYPGVSEGLRALKQASYRLAMVSNKPREACAKLLRHFGLADLFDCMLGGGDTQHLKPHPEPLLRAMKATGAAADQTWMIGDHRTDIEAARRAGVRSVFLRGGMGRLEGEAPTYTFDCFAEAVRWFLEHRTAMTEREATT